MKLLLLILSIIPLLFSSAHAGNVVALPSSSSVDIYINSKVGTTVRFPMDILLVTPLTSFKTTKVSSRYLQIEYTGNETKEPVTIVTGNADLHIRLRASRNADRFATITIPRTKERSLRQRLIESLVSGTPKQGVTIESFKQDALEIMGLTLKPYKIYKAPPYIALVFAKKGKSKEFSIEKTTIGNFTDSVWAMDLGSHVSYIIDDRNQIGKGFSHTIKRSQK